MENQEQNQPLKKGFSSRREERNEKKKQASSETAPQFIKKKKLFKKRSFARQYRLFRQGGLGITDSFFNSLYITVNERSVEREEKRLRAKGKEVSPQYWMAFQAPMLRFVAFVAKGLHLFVSLFSFFKRKNDHIHVERFRSFFGKKRWVYGAISLFAVLIALHIAFTLRLPVVLQAEIDGNVIGVVENKNIVDSAIRALEKNVEFILGENFGFPYEVRYTFRRSRSDTLSTKAQISEALYTYVQDSICTAAGLYVDDVLVAVCRDEKSVQDGIAAFLANNSDSAGIFNEIHTVTQAYPTDCLMTSDQLTQLMEEMKKPLEERKKTPLPDDSISVGLLEDTKEEEDATLLSDIDPIWEDAVTISNRPQSIEKVKLDLYYAEEITYTAEVPFETVYVESDQHYTTMTDVTVKGSNGKSEFRAAVYYVDGKEINREILEERVISKRVDRVISIGTKMLPEELGFTSFTEKPKRFIMPRIAEVSSQYGYREDGDHKGLDIPDDEGESIYASASGTVVVAIGQDGPFSNMPQNYFTGYGYCVVIEHEDGFSTMYAHCSRINVTLGQKVSQGEKIAEIGNTGVSQGNHVHFEVRKDGVPVNPTQYLYSGTYTIYDKVR